jgi:hypothetical protein
MPDTLPLPFPGAATVLFLKGLSTVDIIISTCHHSLATENGSRVNKNKSPNFHRKKATNRQKVKIKKGRVLYTYSGHSSSLLTSALLFHASSRV